MALKSVAKNLWTREQALTFFGVEVGTRMTVVDLDGNGTLLVHSPSQLDDECRSALESLGTVTYVVSPNKWHHLFISEFKTVFPKAKFFCAPGLEVKRPDFQFDAVIDEAQNYPWNPMLAHMAIKGVPMYNEIVFFHPMSKTLIVTDLAVHICESRSLRTRLLLRLLGSYGKFGWSKIEKFLFIRDKAAFQRTLGEVLKWDFDRIILAHGKPIEFGGKDYLAQAFQ